RRARLGLSGLHAAAVRQSGRNGRNDLDACAASVQLLADGQNNENQGVAMKPLVWLDWLAPLSLAVVDRLRLMERFPAATARNRMKWVTLKGGETAWECTRRLYADMISIAFIGFVLIASLG